MPPPFRSIPESPPPGETLRSVGRGEWLAVGGVVLLGLVLRGLLPGTLAVEHFDEGVYASNLYCAHLDPPFAYPMRHLYAPPLFPAVLEWAQILAGPSAVMWVNVLLGSLTVAAVWYATRCWFGRSAAIAAALLAATSEYHIAFSRMALTDVPLSLLMLLGVFAGWRAIPSGRPAWIAIAGVLAGLAWCTKYNGWLTLAVTGSGTAAALLVPQLLTNLVPKLHLGNALAAKLKRRERDPQPSTAHRDRRAASLKFQISDLKFGPAIVRWGLAAAIAGVMFWVFVVCDLAPLGGYAAVAKNHAGYFVGPGGWWPGFLRQAQAHELLMGWPTCLGIAAAWLAGASRRHRPADGNGPRWWSGVPNSIALVGSALLLAVLARWFNPSGLVALAAIVGAATVLRRRNRSGGDGNGTPLAAWMLLAWFVGLLVATPLYFPYPRLSVPWVVGAWPLAGAGITAILEWLAARGVSELPVRSAATDSHSAVVAVNGPARTHADRIAYAVALGGLLVLGYWGVATKLQPFLEEPWPKAWQWRTGRADAASRILSTMAVGSGDAVVYVDGDPALYYQLSAQARLRGDRLIIVPVADPNVSGASNGVPTWLVTRSRPDQVGAGNRRIVASELTAVSDMVLMDRIDPSALHGRAAIADTFYVVEIGAAN